MGSGLSNLLNDRGQACFTAFVFAKSKDFSFMLRMQVWRFNRKLMMLSASN